jgi:hypothetical protein
MNDAWGWVFGVAWLAVVSFLVGDQYLEMADEARSRKEPMQIPEDGPEIPLGELGQWCGLCGRKGSHAAGCPADPKQQPGRRIPSRGKKGKPHDEG